MAVVPVVYYDKNGDNDGDYDGIDYDDSNDALNLMIIVNIRQSNVD